MFIIKFWVTLITIIKIFIVIKNVIYIQAVALQNAIISVLQFLLKLVEAELIKLRRRAIA